METDTVSNINHNKSQEVESEARNQATKEEKFLDSEIETMFQAGAHYGYSRTKRHPKMSSYIFGAKNGVEIFDLEKTKLKLSEALKFMNELGTKNSAVLYVGAKPPASHLIEKHAKEAGLPYFANRWIGGFLTNFSEVKKRLEYYKELETKKSAGELAKYPTKQRMDLERDLKNLENNFCGVKEMKNLPQVLLIIDAKEESTAVREARRIKIPIVALMNSDNNPDDADYAIPANDSAPKSIEYFLNRLTGAYLEGKKEPVSDEKPQKMAQA